MFGGRKEVCFDGGIVESPCRVKVTLPLTEPVTGGSFKVDFNYDITVWEGLPILQLPFFDRLISLLQAVWRGDRIKVLCEIKGNRIFAGTSKPNIGRGLIDANYDYTQLINKARAIGDFVHINPLLPKLHTISKEDIESIHILHHLIENKEYRQSGSGTRFSCDLVPNERFWQMFETDKDPSKSGPLEITPLDQEFKVFGEEFDFYPLRYTLTRPRLLTQVADAKKQKHPMMKEGIRVEWVGTEESELIISVIQADDSNESMQQTRQPRR
jgi:hypothetical protein